MFRIFSNYYNVHGYRVIIYYIRIKPGPHDDSYYHDSKCDKLYPYIDGYVMDRGRLDRNIINLSIFHQKICIHIDNCPKKQNLCTTLCIKKADLLSLIKFTLIY